MPAAGLPTTRSDRIGLFRREPARRGHPGSPEPGRSTCRRSTLGARGAALAHLALIAPPPEPPPEVMPRTVTLTERAAIIRAALRDAPAIVLQDLLRGVRDRVVVAVTFLAMLELMKRREIVVEQAEPWGAIVARRRRRGAGRGRRRSTKAWSPSRDRRRWTPSGPRPSRAALGPSSGEPATSAAAARADRDRARGAALRRRAAAVPPRDRDARRRRPGHSRSRAGRPRGELAERGHPPRRRRRSRRARDARPRRERWSRATSARTRSGCRRRASRRWRSSPTASPSPRRDRADPRRRFRLHGPFAAASPAHRRARPVGGAGAAVPVRDGLRVPRAVRADRASSELPPLDVDVAARLAEEGGEPLTEPLPLDDGRRADRGLMPPERLQKVLAAAGVASRRGAEALIAAGRVTVDGSVATLGDAGRPGTVRSSRSTAGSSARRPLTRTCCCTSPPGSRRRRATATRRRPCSTSSRRRSYPTARGCTRSAAWTRTSEGLLLLTNDGDWAERVLHPRHGVEREYAHRRSHRPLERRPGPRRCERGHRARRRAARRSAACAR